MSARVDEEWRCGCTFLDIESTALSYRGGEGGEARDYSDAGNELRLGREMEKEKCEDNRRDEHTTHALVYRHRSKGKYTNQCAINAVREISMRFVFYFSKLAAFYPWKIFLAPCTPFDVRNQKRVSHTACKDEFRPNLRSHSWNVFYYYNTVIIKFIIIIIKIILIKKHLLLILILTCYVQLLVDR